FISRHIVGNNISMKFQHYRKDDAMEYNVVLTNKVYKPGIFIHPEWFPVTSIIQRPLFSGTYITYGCIKPHIQYLSLAVGIFFYGCSRAQRKFYTPVKIPCYSSWLKTGINP